MDVDVDYDGRALACTATALLERILDQPDDSDAWVALRKLVAENAGAVARAAALFPRAADRRAPDPRARIDRDLEFTYGLLNLVVDAG